MSLREVPGALPRLPHFLQSLIAPIPSKPVVYVSDQSDWVIRWIGEYLEANLKPQGLSFSRNASSLLYANTILHFGSVYSFSERKPWTIHPSNTVITTMYHGNRGIDAPMDAAIDRVLARAGSIDKLVVSFRKMRERLISWGFPAQKITLIPIGYRSELFSPATAAEKSALREKLGLPKDKILIGSFQKDGSGWGDGNEPKLIKGPDLFADTLARLAKDFPVHAVLTGPSRGYVKNRLTEAGVPFSHFYPKELDEVSNVYRTLDMYLMSSREEGGPIALMESMGSGVPLVSTKVGMAPDIIENGQNAMLADPNGEDLYRVARLLLGDSGLRTSLAMRGPPSVKHLCWSEISKQYLGLYRGVLR